MLTMNGNHVHQDSLSKNTDVSLSSSLVMPEEIDDLYKGLEQTSLGQDEPRRPPLKGDQAVKGLVGWENDRVLLVPSTIIGVPKMVLLPLAERLVLAVLFPYTQR